MVGTRLPAIFLTAYQKTPVMLYAYSFEYWPFILLGVVNFDIYRPYIGLPHRTPQHYWSFL